MSRVPYLDGGTRATHLWGKVPRAEDRLLARARAGRLARSLMLPIALWLVVELPVAAIAPVIGGAAAGWSLVGFDGATGDAVE